MENDNILELYSIIDVETTGGKFNEEGITEIAIYKFDGNKIIDQFNGMARAKCPKMKNVFAQVLQNVKDCVKGQLVARGHNIQFSF